MTVLANFSNEYVFEFRHTFIFNFIYLWPQNAIIIFTRKSIMKQAVSNSSQQFEDCRRKSMNEIKQTIKSKVNLIAQHDVYRCYVRKCCLLFIVQALVISNAPLEWHARQFKFYRVFPGASFSLSFYMKKKWGKKMLACFYREHDEFSN